MFLVTSLGFLCKVSNHLQTVIVLLLFQFGFLFFFLSSLIAMSRTCRTMLSNNDEGGHPCFVSDLREYAFNFLVLRIVCCGFVVYNLYYIKICCLYAHFLEGFFFFLIINGCWLLNFVKIFICIYWDDYRVLPFSLLIWFITLIDLHMVKNLCIPWINPTRSWYMILLMCCWVMFAIILLRIFMSIFTSDIDL